MKFFLSAVLLASVSVLSIPSDASAAIQRRGSADVEFHATGPAGLAIVGRTTDLGVREAAGSIVVTVPLANLTTGISLRDKHMKEHYLEVGRFPTTELSVSRAALKTPDVGKTIEGDADGTLSLHGRTHAVRFHYIAKNDGGLSVKGAFHANMADFGIETPNFHGVTVKRDVEVVASFGVAE